MWQISAGIARHIVTFLDERGHDRVRETSVALHAILTPQDVRMIASLSGSYGGWCFEHQAYHPSIQSQLAQSRRLNPSDCGSLLRW